MPFESRAVVAGTLTAAPSHARMREPQEEVLEVGRERLAHQPLDVFKEKRLRPQFVDRAHSFRKHVPLVQCGRGVFRRAKTAGTASAGNDHYIGYSSIVEIPNIALVQRPLVHRVEMKALVLAKGLTGVMISLDHRRMPETGIRHRDRQAAGAGEQLDATHPGTSRSCSASVGRRFHTPRSSTQPTRRDGATKRSPGREPVPVSARITENPVVIGLDHSPNGSEKVRKRLVETETAGSPAGRGSYDAPTHSRCQQRRC